MNKSFLLDTCAVIWLTQNEHLLSSAVKALADCRARGDAVFISSVSAWEMAMLLTRGRIRETRDAKRWYDDFRREADVKEQAVTADIFMAACMLPEPVHKDPIDRILIATARAKNLTIITRDRAILAYCAAGHVRALAC